MNNYPHYVVLDDQSQFTWVVRVTFYVTIIDKYSCTPDDISLSDQVGLVQSHQVFVIVQWSRWVEFQLMGHDHHPIAWRFVV